MVHDGLWPSSSYGLSGPRAWFFLFFKIFFNDKKEKSKMKKIKVTKEIKITTNKKKLEKIIRIFIQQKKEKKCIIKKDIILKKIFKSIKKKKK